jgi:hypothetical protein
MPTPQNLPGLPPGWEYCPMENNSQLGKVVGATRIDDLPLVIVDGRSAVFWEIIKTEIRPPMPLAFYEHLIIRLNRAPVSDNQKPAWTTFDMFVSTHVPGQKQPQLALACHKVLNPVFPVDDPESKAALTEWIDGPEFEAVLKLVDKNMRLAPYFAKHVKKLPRL